MIPAELLPPIPRPPHDPTSLLLNGRLGWRALPGGFIDLNYSIPDQSLALALHPASRRSLSEPSGSFGGLALPTGVALGPDGSLYLLDPKSLALKRFDPCCCRFEDVPCFGGKGSAPRQLLEPHGIGICNGNLYVCDTGNHRLGVFSLRGFGLRAYLAPPRSVDLANPWQPYDLAFDGEGHIYVSDPANGRLHRFSPAGHWEASFPGFGIITHLAIDCQERLFAHIEGAPPLVKVIRSDGLSALVASSPEELTPYFPSLPFQIDNLGRLHLEEQCNVTPCPEAEAECRQPGEGIFDLSGQPVITPPNKLGQVSPPIYVESGIYVSQALDSELYRCQWHRLILDGEIQSGAQVRVSTFTSEALQPDELILDPALPWDTNQTARNLTQGKWDCLVRSGGGRYLWLKLELRGDGFTSPRLRGVEIEFPRISLRRHLPAVFGAEPTSADFTDRFLSLFDTTLRGIEHDLDTQARYYDPLSAPASSGNGNGLDFLTWLASWVGISFGRSWPEERRRRFLKQSGAIFDWRGTRQGLRQELLLLLGMQSERLSCPDCQPRQSCRPKLENCPPLQEQACPWEPPPLILEHFMLRRWLFVGAGRLGDQAVLWGKSIVNRSQLDQNAQLDRTQLKTSQDPYRDPFHVYAHKFSVFVPSRYGCSETERKSLESLLKSESPAHTLAQVIYVEPRFRIGVQSLIGFDSVVARLPQGVTLEQTPLGVASVLTKAAHEQGGPSLEIGGDSRVGTTTRLE